MIIFTKLTPVVLTVTIPPDWWWPSTLDFEEGREDWWWWLIAIDLEEGREESLSDIVSEAGAMHAITAGESDDTVRRIQALLDLLAAGAHSPDTGCVPTNGINEDSYDHEEPFSHWWPELPFDYDSPYR